MRRRLRYIPMTMALLAIVTTGCTSPEVGSAEQARASVSAPAGATADVEPMPTPPSTTSGPLTKRNLPDAAALGKDWAPYPDPGDPAEGYVGNGTPVRERDVQEVADALVPLGCPGVDGLPRPPVPRHALEETYRDSDGRAAVALVLEYGDEASARKLLEGVGAMLRMCLPPSAGSAAPGQLVVEVVESTGDLLVDVRHDLPLQRDAALRWQEVGVRVGPRVGLTILEVPTDTFDADALADALRRVVGN